MKKLFIGGLAVLVGVTGVSVLFSSFLGMILGSLPILMILGGALAFYLGFTDVQEEKKDELAPVPKPKIEPEPILEETVQLETDLETSDPDTGQDKAVTDTPPGPEKATTQEPAPEPILETKPPLFKGNAETLVFHSIDCKFSQGKKCIVEFTTRDEAIEQGYKPCKVCKP